MPSAIVFLRPLGLRLNLGKKNNKKNNQKTKIVQKYQELETKDVQVVYNLAFEDGITIRTYGTAVREDNSVYITDEPLKTSSPEGKRKVSIIDGEQEMFCQVGS